MGQDGYYTAGSEVQLTCTVVTGEAPHLDTPNVCTWTKGGEILPSTSGSVVVAAKRVYVPAHHSKSLGPMLALISGSDHMRRRTVLLLLIRMC